MATITLTNFLARVNNYLGDNISGTTTANGASDGTTFIDSGLAKYDDNYFGDPQRDPQWWAYVGTTLRPIKDFVSNTGTVIVYTAYGSQVSSSTAYSIHRYDRDQKIIACNQALIQCYPAFYKRVEDTTTLDGTGSSATQYTVPATFTEFPDEIYERYVSSDLKYDIPVTQYEVKEIGGSMYFYANITTGRDILLIGKTPLTQFTPGTDTSTTELTTAQADVVALLAAAIFCRTYTTLINAADSGRYDSLAQRFEAMYEEGKIKHGMPFLGNRFIRGFERDSYRPSWSHGTGWYYG